MIYLIVDEVRNDIFVEAYPTMGEAKKMIDIEYAHLTDHDKKRRKGLYILEAENADTLDGNVIYRII